MQAMDVTSRYNNRIELTKVTKIATKPYLVKERIDEDEINNTLITNSKMKFRLAQFELVERGYTEPELEGEDWKDWQGS